MGENSYALISSLFSSRLALAIWVAVSFSFFYHSLNGLRHLAWDFGKGFETHQVNYSGFIVVFLTLALTSSFWFFLLTKHAS
jgi:succinate dehydrogenase / fumarate reductase cytochrome b subunit